MYVHINHIFDSQSAKCNLANPSFSVNRQIKAATRTAAIHTNYHKLARAVN